MDIIMCSPPYPDATQYTILFTKQGKNFHTPVCTWGRGTILIAYIISL